MSDWLDTLLLTKLSSRGDENKFVTRFDEHIVMNEAGNGKLSGDHSGTIEVDPVVAEARGSSHNS